jgi:uncharacterized heparinase superfamily protein
MYLFLQKIRHFLVRGPTTYIYYLRWRVIAIWQRIYPFAYRRERTAVSNSDARSWRNKNTPHFFFTSASIAGIVNRVDDHSRQATLDLANHVCNREFSFRQSDFINLGTDIDWACAPGKDKDWCWDLNRHAYFESLGFAYHYTNDEKYAIAFGEIMNDWLDKNPPVSAKGNWSSAFEVGYRINSWIWAFYLFRNSPSLSDADIVRLISSIETHCLFLAVNIEHHARNNHLLLEAKALFFAAILFPEFSQAIRWRARISRILYRQIREQVHEDGVHGELSTLYHRIIAGELLELLLLMRLNGLVIPEDIEERIRNMVQFESYIKRPDGTIPLFGDSSQQDNYVRLPASVAGPRIFELDRSDTPVDEASEWRLAEFQSGKTPPVALHANKSIAFADGGYFLMRSGVDARDAMYMCVDCGPFGLDWDPHHGHADALSFEVYAKGRPWIVVSGVYCTHAQWAWRRYFRGTRSHNTMMVDDQDQTELLDSRRIMRAANAETHRWLTSPRIDYFEGSHDGYRRLRQAVKHTRCIWFVRGEYWLILDILDGEGTHLVESNFHFPEDISVDVERENALLTDTDGRALAVACDGNKPVHTASVAGGVDPIQGWRSSFSGQKLAAPTLSYSARTGVPLQRCTALMPLANQSEPRPLVCMNMTSDGSVVTVSMKEFTDYFFHAAENGNKLRKFAEFQTEATIAFVRKPAEPAENSSGFCDIGELAMQDGTPIERHF